MFQPESLLIVLALSALSPAPPQGPPALDEEEPYVFPEEGPGELIVIYHENGKKAREGKIWKGRRHGLWRGFHENGERAFLGRIQDYHRVGLWKTFYENGSPL